MAAPVGLLQLVFSSQLQEDSGNFLSGGTEDVSCPVHHGLCHQQKAWRYEVRCPSWVGQSGEGLGVLDLLEALWGPRAQIHNPRAPFGSHTSPGAVDSRSLVCGLLLLPFLCFLGEGLLFPLRNLMVGVWKCGCFPWKFHGRKMTPPAGRCQGGVSLWASRQPGQVCCLPGSDLSVCVAACQGPQLFSPRAYETF